MTAKALAIVAAVIIGAGALVGLIPVTSEGVNCGSAFVKSNDALVSDLTQSMSGKSTDTVSACTDLRSLIRIPALVLLLGGMVALAGAGIVDSRRQNLTATD
ncbi:hypothetical protein AB0395_41205 [Streptosporangium sp. NPDC051023]|uniref:hypothetical protein n=1 Tax=Streptosporangium sp. NPDC051023 TaxID=3155410 RepID=UPI00344D5207